MEQQCCLLLLTGVVHCSWPEGVTRLPVILVMRFYFAEKPEERLNLGFINMIPGEQGMETFRDLEIAKAAAQLSGSAGGDFTR